MWISVINMSISIHLSAKVLKTSIIQMSRSYTTMIKVRPFLNAKNMNMKRNSSTDTLPNKNRIHFTLTDGTDVSKIMRLDVSKYKGKIYLNLRKWFHKNSDPAETLLPSKTGIVLGEQDWAILKRQVSA